jgi:putative nucleotidyltransferase with HDIG domain
MIYFVHIYVLYNFATDFHVKVDIKLETENEQTIAKQFPDVAKIKDAKLRNGVCTSWLKAWKYGECKRIRDAYRSPKLPTESLVPHVNAVTTIGASIAAVVERAYGFEIDWDRLYAASLLHDIDKLITSSPKAVENFVKSHPGVSTKHGELGAAIAREVGVRDDVAEIIATHSGQATVSPKSLEGIINKYADFVESDCNFFMRGKELLLDRRK